MTETKKQTGLIIGLLFTIASLLMSFTSLVPVISVLPGVFFEILSKAIISNEPYRRVGELTIFLLTITLIFTIALSIWDIRKLTLEQRAVAANNLIGKMTIFYFIVHPLGFYIYWGLDLHFHNSGQPIFAVVDSFPFTSFSFILLGLLLDWVRNTTVTMLLKKEKE